MTKQNKVAKKKAKNIAVTSQEISVSSAHSGPIPSPDILQQYNLIVPGAAERILAMAEREALARQEGNTLALSTNAKNAELEVKIKARSQIAAVLVFAMAMSVTSFAIYKELTEVAIIIGGATIVSVISALLYSNKKNN